MSIDAGFSWIWYRRYVWTAAPDLNALRAPLVAVTPLQLMAYPIAPHLAKSATVE